MATNNISPKKGKVVDIPTAPTIGTATAGGESATVAFTAATKGGPITTYTALSNPGSVTGTGSSSPITVTGLTAGTSYTFTVRGNNATGSGEYSSASNSITALVGSAYESIQTVTVGSGGSSTVSFTSIPSTYKHLQIRFISNNASNQNVFMRFNGDTTSGNYTRHYLYGDGTSAASGGNVSDGQLSVGYTSTSANIFGGGVVDVLDYTSTSKNKTIRSLAGHDANGSGLAVLYSGLWSKTPEAITSISIYAGAGNINQNSQFALYGIKG